MENRSGPLAAHLILVLLCLAAPAWAADGPSPDQEADWNSRLRQAEELRNEGATRKAAAEKRFAEEEAACNRKFLVNQCREEAKLRRIPEVDEARRLEIEGKRLEQAVRQEQFADSEARRAAEVPEREADWRKRAGETGARRQETDSRIESRQAQKEKDAEAGRKRRAERQAEIARKQAEHAAKVEEKRRAAEQKPAQ